MRPVIALEKLTGELPKPMFVPLVAGARVPKVWLQVPGLAVP